MVARFIGSNPIQPAAALNSAFTSLPLASMVTRRASTNEKAYVSLNISDSFGFYPPSKKIKEKNENKKYVIEKLMGCHLVLGF
ncbi:Protein of unknown function D [Prunus dulcis]|uniref:Uncharacterized protein n=1 Tax=Prunus dulcis TaxID=3755 RepID=A0A4Y1RLU9_PRUDU|nr:Protein of unknown function D [Prunus dulcis]